MSEPRWMKELRKLPGGARVIAKYQRPKGDGEGERLPDFVHETGSEYFRLDTGVKLSYVKCIQVVQAEHHMDDASLACSRCGLSVQFIQAEDAPCAPVSWWACDPLGHWLTVSGHRAIEEADGTLTVDGVIDNRGPYEPWWRGKLLHGKWLGDVIHVEGSQAVE